MAADPNSVEQVVSRTLRDNLEKIQRTADELHQAVNDMVSACASTRASNALPPMVRAQTAAASLSATLEVLSRFVTSALQPAMRLPFEPEILRVPSMSSAPPATPFEQRLPAPPAPPSSVFEQPPPAPLHPIEEIPWVAPASAAPAPPVSETPPPVEAIPATADAHSPVEVPAFSEMPPVAETLPVVETPAAAETSPAMEMPSVAEPAAVDTSRWNEPVPAFEPVPEASGTGFSLSALDAEAPAFSETEQQVEQVESAPAFNLDMLPPEEQELHRRAFRVAKVSMQDIKMLRPEDVRMGRENKDLCFRLRDDIEKAHKEYDRRFQSIQSHPVDYFYDWMVEILGGGDPQALGEYPYPTAVLRR
jgi:uncharacterized damage-inducible protein DinB